MIANPAAATKAGSRARRFSPRFTTLIAIPLVAVLGTFSMTAQAWDWGFGWLGQKCVWLRQHKNRDSQCERFYIHRAQSARHR